MVIERFSPQRKGWGGRRDSTGLVGVLVLTLGCFISTIYFSRSASAAAAASLGAATAAAMGVFAKKTKPNLKLEVAASHEHSAQRKRHRPNAALLADWYRRIYAV